MRPLATCFSGRQKKALSPLLRGQDCACILLIPKNINVSPATGVTEQSGRNIDISISFITAIEMTYYSFMAPGRKKVQWIYGFEIDYDIIERVDKERRTFFSTSTTEDEYNNPTVSIDDEDMYTNPTERATEFLQREFGCIAPMLGWDPDSPTKEKTYVLVVHAHSTPKGPRDKERVMRVIARLRTELMPEVKARAKWYFSCGAGVLKGDVDWATRPEPFYGHQKMVGR